MTSAIDSGWRRHKASCAACDRASRAKRLDKACDVGNALLNVRADLLAREAAERRRSTEPTEGQEALW